MQLYDTIVLKESHEDMGVPVGSRGVILIVYDEPSKAYEVEFVDCEGGSLGTFLVLENQIELLREPPRD